MSKWPLAAGLLASIVAVGATQYLRGQTKAPKTARAESGTEAPRGKTALPADPIATAPDDPGYSARHSYLKALRARAKRLRLHEHRYWLLLGHYRTSRAGFESLQDGSTFFLAADGKTNPQAELDATLRAFFDTALPKGNPNLHPQCRFPARWHWLTQQLHIDRSYAPRPDCQLLQATRRFFDIESVSLMFASYYMNAPASMFGHTLLKLNRRGGSSYDLLNYAVNFAAYPGDLDPVRYVLYGLLGGYAGQFALLPYHVKVREYSDIESRDIWEYRLNLNAQEIERLFLHAYELVGTATFRYFYLDENCSYQLLTLLEAARPSLRLAEQFGGVLVIPGETIKAVVRERGLVQKVFYRPSLHSKIKARIKELQPEEEDAFLQLLDGDSEPSVVLAKLPGDRAANVVDLALLGMRFRGEQNRTMRSEKSKNYRSLLMYRTQLPVLEDPPEVAVPGDPPDVGHSPNMIQAAAGVHNELAGFVGLRWRPVFHDLMNVRTGYAPNSELAWLNTELHYYPEHARLILHRFSFLRLGSFVPWDSFGRANSYLIDSGAFSTGQRERLDQKARDLVQLAALATTSSATRLLLYQEYGPGRPESIEYRTVPRLEGLYGWTFGRVQGSEQALTLSLLGGGRFEWSGMFERGQRFGPQLALVFIWATKSARFFIQASAIAYSVSGNTDAADVRMGLGLSLARDTEIRFEAGAAGIDATGQISLARFF